MERIFHHYEKWEDYQAGMYEAPRGGDAVTLAVRLLSNPTSFRGACERVMSEWPISLAENLSNTSANRRAWMGRAACCIQVGATERDTRSAWALMSERKREEANNIADAFIKKYEKENKEVHQPVGVQVLF